MTNLTAKVFRVFKVFRVLSDLSDLSDLKDPKDLNKTNFPNIKKLPYGRTAPQSGNYKNLLSYQKTDIIYQLTFYFCHTYLAKGDRTLDQMIQAARSGKQNIIEGCAASATSAKTEIKLLNVAKASLKELLEDYEDFLKTHGDPQWQKGDDKFEAMRKLGREPHDAEFFLNIAHTRPASTIANMAIILINQADYLLYRQLDRLEKDFIQNGGFSERMTALRRKTRGF